MDSSIIAVIIVLALVGALAVAALAVSITNPGSCECPTEAGGGAAAPVATSGIEGPEGPPGPSEMADGTEAFPSLPFTTDPTTGFYKDGDGIGMSSSGSGRFTVNDNGVLLKQTTAPSSVTSTEMAMFTDTNNELNVMGQNGQSKELTNQDYGHKRSVRAATTANGALATAYAAGQTIDGVVLGEGDRILLKNQTSPIENGVYIVQATGAPVRAPDFEASTQFTIGTKVLCMVGTANAATTFYTSTFPTVVGVNNWDWSTSVAAPLAINGLTDAQTVGVPTATNVLDYNFTTSSIRIGDSGALTTQLRNVIIGHQAANVMTGSTDSVIIGRDAGLALLTGDSNTIIGTNAMNVGTTAHNNTVLGIDAGQGLTTGNSNVILGRQCDGGATTAANVSIGFAAGSATCGNNNLAVCQSSSGNLVATDDNNIAIGVQSLGAASGGTCLDNIAIGRQAIFGSGSTAGAADNVGIGRSALLALSTGGTNTCIGLNSGNAITTGSNNVCLGVNTGNGPTATGCVAIGDSSGSGTSGSDCVAIGNNAANALVASSNTNIAVGLNAMGAVAGGTNTNNIAIGQLAMNGSGATVGTTNNIAIGLNCLDNITTGSSNVCIGSNSGGSITTGVQNTCLGLNAGSLITTGTDNILLGNSSQVDTGTRNFAVGIGVTTAAADSSFSCVHRTIAAGTNASFTGNELHADTSSKRYKRDIVDYEPDFKDFMELRPVNYRAKKGHSGNDDNPLELNKVHAGFIAEEVNEIFPEFVTYDDDEHKVPESVQYGQITALLTKVLQAHHKTIGAYEARITALEGQLAALS